MTCRISYYIAMDNKSRFTCTVRHFHIHQVVKNIMSLQITKYTQLQHNNNHKYTKISNKHTYRV